MNKLPARLDKLLTEINLNDNVVFGKAGRMRLIKGNVTKINAKTVTIEHEEYSTEPYSTATNIHTLIDQLDKAKLEYSNLLQKGASLVIDVQDYTSPEDVEDLFFGYGKS